jgi:hypothetical protein
LAPSRVADFIPDFIPDFLPYSAPNSVPYFVPNLFAILLAIFENSIGRFLMPKKFGRHRSHASGRDHARDQ